MKGFFQILVALTIATGVAGVVLGGLAGAGYVASKKLSTPLSTEDGPANPTGV